MARLASPPTLSLFAARASKSANPAAHPPGAQCAPIQSAASTTLSAVPMALQHSQSARHASAVASKTIHGKSSNLTNTTSSVQVNMRMQTRIPAPKTTKTPRKYLTIAYKVKTEYMDVDEPESDDDDVIEIDNNPELLNDVSFDETLDRHQQSSWKGQVGRYEALAVNIRKGCRCARVPTYSGDQFVLARKRTKVSEKVVPRSKIPRKMVTTLEYKSIALSSPGFFAQVKADNRFGFKFKANTVLSQSQTVSGSVHLLVVDTTVKPAGKEDRPDSAVDVAFESGKSSKAASVPARKSVRFNEEQVKPLLFHREAFAKDLKSPLVKAEDGWVPLKLDTPYAGTAQATGFNTMFAQMSLHTIGLKRRVLARFKAVQEYEERRKQDALKAGTTPDLGQLEYGNADFKLALQPSKVITANDIGSFVDPSELGIPARTYNPLNGPLLHFGGFEDKKGRTFEDAYIPSSTAAAYKAPIEWMQESSVEDDLHEFVTSAFGAMQLADVVE